MPTRCVGCGATCRSRTFAWECRNCEGSGEVYLSRDDIPSLAPGQWEECRLCGGGGVAYSADWCDCPPPPDDLFAVDILAAELEAALSDDPTWERTEDGRWRKAGED